MSTTPIDTAYVRIRPLTAGFGAETTAGVQAALAGTTTQTGRFSKAAVTAERDAGRLSRGLVAVEGRALGFGRALTFASGAFLAGAGLGEILRVGTEEFTNLAKAAATTNAILGDTGNQAGISAKGIVDSATAIEHRTGVDKVAIITAENLLLTYKSVRNEVGQGNDVFNRATKAAVNLSRVFGGDVSQAARQLGVALADPERGLTRLRRSGIVFTQDQQKQIKALVETGQLLKAQTIILDTVEHKVGGTAQAIGQTLPGQLAILRERARDALGEYVTRLSQSAEAATVAHKAAAGLAGGWDALKATVEALAPPVTAFAKAASGVVSTVGVGPILASVAAYKLFGVAFRGTEKDASLATRAQTLYAKAVGIATGATAAEAGAATAASLAVKAETGSLAGATAAFSGYSVAGGVAVATNEAVTASEVEMGIAGRAAAVGVGASRLALAAVGGTIGAIAIGIAGLVGGFLLLRRRGQDAAGGINATRKALDLLSESVKRGEAITQAIGKARSAVDTARATQGSERDALAAALAAQGRSTAQPGSLEARALADRVAVARAKLTQATRDLTKAENDLDAANQARTAHQQLEAGVAAEETQKLLGQVSAVRQAGLAAAFASKGFAALRAGIKPTAAEIGGDQLARFVSLVDKLSTDSDKAKAKVGAALERIALATKAIPSSKEIRIVVGLAERGKSLAQILNELRVGVAESVSSAALDSPQRARVLALLDARTAAARAARTAALDENAALQAQYEAAKKILATDEKDLATKKTAARTAADQLETAKASVAAAKDALASAQDQLRASQQALADAIKAGQASVNSAVQQAKQNLRTIADAIAAAIGQLADAGGAKLGPKGPLSAQFQALKAQILAGQGGPQTQLAAQRVAAEIQAQSATGTDVAAKAKQRLQDLTDAFDRGRISLPQFNKQLTALLSSFGLNLKTFGKDFGTAALHDLQDQIRAARQQAAALAAGPRRPGGGQEPTIVRPLDAVAQATRQVRDAEHAVDRAQRDIAARQRELQQKQYAEQRAQTKSLAAIRVAVEAQLKVAREKAKISKPKPQGSAGAAADSASRAGATAP